MSKEIAKMCTWVKNKMTLNCPINPNSILKLLVVIKKSNMNSSLETMVWAAGIFSYFL